MKVRNRRSALAAVAAAAVLLALTAGGAVAGHKVTSKDIKNHTIRGKDVHSATLGYGTLTKAARAKLRGPAGPIAGYASGNTLNPLDGANHVLALSLTDASARHSGALRLVAPSRLVATASVEMYHSGGSGDLPAGVVCEADAVSGAQVVPLAGPLRMEVFGQSNHNAYVTLALNGGNDVPAGTWDVQVSCWQGYPDNSTYPHTTTASLDVVAFRR